MYNIVKYIPCIVTCEHWTKLPFSNIIFTLGLKHPNPKLLILQLSHLKWHISDFFLFFNFVPSTTGLDVSIVAERTDTHFQAWLNSTSEQHFIVWVSQTIIHDNKYCTLWSFLDKLYKCRYIKCNETLTIFTTIA